MTTPKGSVPVEELKKLYKDQMFHIKMIGLDIPDYMTHLKNLIDRYDNRPVDWAKVDSGTLVKCVNGLFKDNRTWVFIGCMNGVAYLKDQNRESASPIDADRIKLANPDEAPEHWFKES